MLMIKALQNGDFEAGANGGWQEHTLKRANLIIHESALSVTPHSGVFAAHLANANNEVAVIEQDVTVQSTSSVLTYWYQIESKNKCGFDIGGVVVNDQVIDQFDLCQATQTTGWQQRRVDLSQFAGQTVNLQFRAETDAAAISTLYIDDVVLIGE